MKHDIAICYRMTDAETAIFLKKKLQEMGFSVSESTSNFGGGYWRKTMHERIEECKDCIIIISDRTFKRPTNNHVKEDYLVEEITQAFKKKKRIIPVIKDQIGRRYIPSDVEKLISPYNMIKYHDTESDGFENLIGKLIGANEEPFLLSSPHTELSFYKESMDFDHIINHDNIIPFRTQYRNK